jgi:hypothetical protein
VEKHIHIILSVWILSNLGHAILSVFYEQTPAVFIVPVIYAVFVLIAARVWARDRRAARLCAILSIVTIVIQGVFISCRDAYGSLSIPVLVFDILGIAACAAYLVFYFSPSRERYLSKPAA